MTVLTTLDGQGPWDSSPSPAAAQVVQMFGHAFVLLPSIVLGASAHRDGSVR